jgi:hemerythrin
MWSTEYSVEVSSFDHQHQKLFGMLNELHDAMKVGKGSQAAPAILKSLVEYTRQHFSMEEEAMSRTKYPEFISHKAEHDELTHEVEKMVHEFDHGKAVLSTNLLEFLRDWLTKHILSTDKRYSNHMNSAQVR